MPKKKEPPQSYGELAAACTYAAMTVFEKEGYEPIAIATLVLVKEPDGDAGDGALWSDADPERSLVVTARLRECFDRIEAAQLGARAIQ